MRRSKGHHLGALVAVVAGCGGSGSLDLAATSQTVTVNNPVVWSGLVNTSVSGDTLTKTAGVNQVEDAGAVSQQSIIAGDAAFQYVIDDSSRFRFVGLGHAATWQGAANIDYSFRMQATHADIYERGAYVMDIGVVPGDVMKITVSNGIAYYKQNGNIVHTSTLAPVYPMRGIASMIDSGSTVFQATMSVPAIGAPGHHLCGWLQGQGDNAPTDLNFTDFVQHASSFDAVHPTWWDVNATPGTIPSRGCCRTGGIFCEAFGNPSGGNPNVGNDTACRAPQVRDQTTYAGKHTKLIPMVAATVNGEIQAAQQMLASTASMDQWVAELVRIAQVERYDGFDIDFEHLRDAAHPDVRSQFTTFMTKLAAGLHGAGKTVSVAVAGFSGSDAGSMWDVAALLAVVDELHVMGYDYHFAGGSHPGLTDPYGWTHAVMQNLASLNGGATLGKIIWGLPNYGVQGPELTTPVTAIGNLHLALANHPGYMTTSNELDGCTLNRDTHFPSTGRTPNQAANGVHAYFDDILSLEDKVSDAQAYGFRGITYWTIGGEPDQPAGRTFFDMVRAHFPAH
jgi:spore germination protein YaaH